MTQNQNCLIGNVFRIVVLEKVMLSNMLVLVVTLSRNVDDSLKGRSAVKLIL